MTKKDQDKKPLDMTTDEAMNFLFPKKVVEELKHVAHKADKPKEPEDDDESAYKHPSK